MPRYGLWGPTLGLVVETAWTAFDLGARLIKRYRIPLSELFQWGKLALVTDRTLFALRP